MLFVEIVAPDRKVFRGEAAGVQAPGVEGSFEVRTNHAPMIAAFGIGPLIGLFLPFFARRREARNAIPSAA